MLYTTDRHLYEFLAPSVNRILDPDSCGIDAFAANDAVTEIVAIALAMKNKNGDEKSNVVPPKPRN
jgi:hypothetical protein